MSDLLSLHFLETNKQYFMEESDLTVGKSEECSLQLFKAHFNHPVETISRRHFKISKAKDGFVLIDLLSRNGTKINQNRVIANIEYLLRDGDIITLAKNEKFNLQVAIHPSDSTKNFDHGTKVVDGTEMIQSDVIQEPAQAEAEPAKMTFYFDPKIERFVLDDRLIPITHFTELEYELLCYLYKNAERLCLYSEITEKVWQGWVSSNNIISSAVGRIRRKLNKLSDGAGKRYIKTKQGFGYMLTLEKTD